VKPRYPQNMTFTEWRRTPLRTRHRLLGLMVNDYLRHWHTCADARCRRARSCQDYQCYWRRLQKMPFEEGQRLREAVKPLAKLLWIGCTMGAEGRQRY